MMTRVRTRFAPSPTGYLHIGGARTALYSWLYARRMQGTFILRIEDTDLERSTSESIEAILEGMKWLNLNFDEGPFYQTERFNRYREVLAQLLEEDKAYRCYCSKERLENLRLEQMAKKEKPRYDGFCRHHQQEKKDPYVIRFKNPEDGTVTFTDLVRGSLTFANKELDDLIIARSDGVPTYNFTVVVDDADMEITHVIRGDDHINNTPRQINILKALAANVPQYAHLPMILGPDGKRLSKRLGAASVLNYREEGFLPEALTNYLVRLGWSHGDQEIFSTSELISLFDLTHINRSPAALNPEKLLWLNQHYLKHSNVEQILPEFIWHMDRLHINPQSGPPLAELIAVQASRCKTVKEIAERSRYFYQDIFLSDEAKQNFSADQLPILRTIREHLTQVSWDKESIHQMLLKTSEQYAVKLGKLAQPLRMALTGDTVSPPIDITIILIGRARALQRLDNIISFLEK